MLSHSSEEERRINRLEHAKFLLYQIQQELAGTNHNKDCVIQCQDGDLSTSLANLASISLLVRNIGQEDETPVIIVPSLQLGELLLFLKYLFSNKVEEMFNKEDVGVIENVCHILEIDIGWKPRSEDPDLAIIGVHRTEVEPQTEPSPPEIKDDKTFREKRIKEQEKLRTKIRCKFCDEMVPFTVLSKHVKQKHPEKDLCCLVCEYRGESKTELETHVQTHAGDLHYLSCERCGHVVLSQYQLQRHRRTHNLKNLPSEKCPHCEKMFQVKDKLNKHVLLHTTGVLDKRFGCDECEKEFSKPYDLARHKKSHSGVKTHFCDICGDRFVDGTRLKQHKWIHSDHKGLKCPAEGCSQSFRLQSHLKSHLASLHPDLAGREKLLECAHCRRTFAYEYKLKQHLEWHSLDLAQRVEQDVTEYNILNMKIVQQSDQ